ISIPSQSHRPPPSLRAPSSASSPQDRPLPYFALVHGSSALDLEPLKIERGQREASRGRRPPWFGRVLVLAVLGGLLFLFRRPLLEQIDRLRLPVVHVIQVSATSPLAASAVQGTAANGYVVPRVRAALSADTPGRIVEMNVTEGSVVKKGDVVARLFS